MRHVRTASVIIAALAVVALVGCATAPTFTGRSAGGKGLAKGQTGSITGKLEKNKNQYVLTDSQTGVAYRFVGLGKDAERQLIPYVGKKVTVKLTVESTESAKVANAKFVAIVK